MPKIFSTLPLVTALVFSTALHAQEETADQNGATTAPETQAQDDANTAGGQLQMGRQVSEDDATYIKETYDDWQLKCFRNQGEGDDICQMYQLLTEDSGNPVAEFSIFRLPEGGQAAAGGTIVVPLGTLLGEELTISVDGGAAKRYPYSFCTMTGCFARIGFTEADVTAFKRGASAMLRIVPAQAPDQVVEISASLDGFTAAYENVSTIRN
ncbi:invasion associated locus B family protein [Roseovarius sp. SYSU LYC5161]|uniref:invasion associated locus B family protein n=1 Tax=Roseovarius halophilus (ex Wu et al. 2025) TaxID=3376060 RepID=UPI0028721A0A|nr:invasion associated locus B family protein [Roseovarius sp.]